MTKTEFQELVKHHNWHYNRSDDHRKWEKGSRIQAQIDSYMEALTGFDKIEAEQFVDLHTKGRNATT